MSFLSEYQRYVEHVNTDPLWKTWCGISCLSAAVGRKVWISLEGRETFGNFFVLLVGTPGDGKDTAMNPTIDLLSHIPSVYFSSHDSNAAVLVQEASEAVVSWTNDRGLAQTYNTLFVCTPEFKTILPEYEAKLIAILTQLYDCKPYRKSTIGRGKEELGESYINILAATHPAYLQETIPESAWNEGFMSRMILVYGEGMPPRPLSQEDPPVTSQNAVINKLKVCAARKGRVMFDKDALLFLNDWQHKKMPPRPTHPRLVFYNKRRMMHVLKLSLLLAVDREAKMIEEEDAAQAVALLTQTEDRLPKLFQAMKTSKDVQIMAEAVYFVREGDRNAGKPVTQQSLTAFLLEKTEMKQIPTIINGMVQAGALKREGNGYVPGKMKAE